MWCGGACVLPTVAADGGLSCAPANLAKLPADFAWGSATAAYQIEGAYNEDGRGLSIWDTFSHLPGKTRNGDTGDVADDHYHKWRTDLALVAGMGLSHYRLSLSWSRILPSGTGTVNEAGLEFYDDLINGLLEKGITPLVTLYHWDLPLALEDGGGWRSAATVAAFVEYAAVVFARFADRVPLFATFNEPNTFVRQGFSEGNHAPGRCSDADRCGAGHGDSFTEPYIVAHNVLLAHARAVAVFRGGQWAQYGGQVGIVLNGEWGEPADPSNAADMDAAQRYMEAEVGWFMDPLAFGDYPSSLRRAVGDRLPQFSAEDQAALTGSLDFLGFNFYTAQWVTPLPPDRAEDPAVAFWGRDLGLLWSGTNPRTGQDIGPQGESPWLFSAPGGLRNYLTWLNRRYLQPLGKRRGGQALPVYITENGCSAPGESEQATLAEQLADGWRVAYYFEYLEAAIAARAEDGVPLAGYFAWSLLDNFEWADGYHMRFGLHHVDFEDPQLPRRAKASATWYAALVKAAAAAAAAAQPAVEAGAAPPSDTARSLPPLALLAAATAAFGLMAASALRKKEQGHEGAAVAAPQDRRSGEDDSERGGGGGTGTKAMVLGRGGVEMVRSLPFGAGAHKYSPIP